MTTPTEPPAAPLPPPTPSAPVQVIGYAGIGTDYVVPTGVKVLLGFLAALHLMIGLPLILWPIVLLGIDLVSRGIVDPDHLTALAFGFAAGAPSTWCGIAMLVKRRRGTWRAVHAILAVLCGLELLGFMGGAVLVVLGKHATGWDQISLVFGLFIAAAASVVFWLHAGTKLALLHPRVRRAFLFERDEPVRLQRIGTMTMMWMYGVVLLVALTAYALR